MTPEGFKLGTICILDTETRPHGLTPEQLNTLKDLADMTVKVMVDRRYQLNKKKSEEDPAQKFSYTAHDLMAPLTGIHSSLSMLKDDSVVKSVLGEHQFELLCTAAACSQLMIRICKEAVDGLHPKVSTKSSILTTGLQKTIETNNSNLTNVQELLRSLQMIAEPIAKVPCIVTLDQAVPSVIVADDLKLFRSSVNLLTNAISRTVTGMVHLSIRLDETVVLFECEDTGEDIPVDEYQYLFQPRPAAGSARVGLSSIASLIDSLEGEYGFRPRDGYAISSSTGRRRSGSIFWFSIPLILPEQLEKSQDGALSKSMIDRIMLPVDVSYRFGTNIPPSIPSKSLSNLSSFPKADDSAAKQVDPAQDSNISGNSVKATSDLVAPPDEDKPLPLNMRKRRALVIDDSVVVRRSLVHTLNSLGFEVVQAEDGEEGLKHLQQTLFDLVLCEFLIPAMNGLT